MSSCYNGYGLNVLESLRCRERSLKQKGPGDMISRASEQVQWLLNRQLLHRPDETTTRLECLRQQRTPQHPQQAPLAAGRSLRLWRSCRT